MNPVPFLVAHGGSLALGTTVVLAVGLLVMACTRQIAMRRRAGGLLTVAVAAYLLVAWLPWSAWRAALEPAMAPTAATAAVSRPAPRPSLAESAAVSLLPPEQRAAAWLRQLETELAELQPAAAVPSSPTAASLSPWPSWLAWTWLAGAALVLIRLLHGLWSLRRLLRSSAPAPLALTAGLALPRAARIRVVPAPVRPFCVGWWRPTVVLTRALCAPERRPQAIAVLRHELAHLQNGDAALQVLLAALSVLLFWHPLFLLLRQQVRFTSELLADDAAAHGHGVHAYAHELIELASREHPMVPALGAVSVFHRPSEFYRRIQMLLQREGSLSVSVPFHRRLTQGLGAASLVAAVGALLPASGRAQDPEPAAAAQAESLRATITALQAEIAQMRVLVESLQHRAVGTQPGEVPEPPAVAATPSPETDWIMVTPPTGSQAGNPVHSVTAASAYRVRRGDTVERILKLHGNADSDGMDRLLQLNPGLEVARLKVGQTLLVPVMSTHVPTTTTDTALAPTTTPDNALAPDTTPALAPADVRSAPPVPATAPATPGDSSLFRYTTVDSTPSEYLRVDSTGEYAVVPPTATPPRPSAPMFADPAQVANATAELTSRYLDLQAEVESLEIEAQELGTLAEAGRASTREARSAQVKLRAASKKLQIVAKLIRGEIAATRAEIETLEQAADDAAVEQKLQRARARLESLQAAL